MGSSPPRSGGEAGVRWCRRLLGHRPGIPHLTRPLRPHGRRGAASAYWRSVNPIVPEGLGGKRSGGDERSPPPDSVGTRHRRHLCERRPRPRHDPPGDASREFRAGRDGDVLDLHRLGAHRGRHALLGRLRPHHSHLLPRRHRHRARRHPADRPNQEDNFGVLASASLVELWDRLTKVLATMAVGIVSVFMVVGGVVIMNIMLAVVTERTYEIGIRKAVGARQRDIMRQFLIESSLLSASGGLAGVTLAWLITVLVHAAIHMPMAVPPSAIAIGVGITAVVGLFFGMYPARRASQLDPIHALRWER